MKKPLFVPALVLALVSAFVRAESAEEAEESMGVAPSKPAAWVGKYPMSGFSRVRTAKTVGKGHLSLSLKMQYCDYDEFLDAGGCYEDLAGGDCNRKFSMVLCSKFGWAKYHHLALGIPYLWNDFDVKGKSYRTDGLGNLFLFEKWNLIRETNTIPGVACDVWYYFPTGDSDRKLGCDDDAWKLTMEVSKAWKNFSVHLNPAYRFNEGRDSDMIEGNAMVLFKPWKTFWPAVEYNYAYKEGAGRCNDVIPGFIWKLAPNATFKLAAVINADTSQKYKDDVGVVAKVFYRF
jgi:hypothetical protein